MHRFSCNRRIVCTYVRNSKLSDISLQALGSRWYSAESMTGSSIFSPEYAFEMASSNIRFGRGVTREIGQDLLNMGLREGVCVVTDPHMCKLPPMQAVLDSLKAANVQFDVFTEVMVEPTDASLQVAIDFAKREQFKGFVAVGGGSVIDTAKAANAYMCNPDADFLDFVNAPVGKGLPIPGQLRPLIAVPTTAGTGSETTGVSIFDHMPTGAKTGIRDRALRPVLGVIDPDHTLHCGRALTAFTGLDVLCHALESYTAVPYKQRITGAPNSPQLRPAYQGSNGISDIWSGFALQQCSKFLRRAVENGEDDLEAREQMCLASTAAGVGFGNAGVHLCHAMSYPISSCVASFRPTIDYDHALAPIIAATTTTTSSNNVSSSSSSSSSSLSSSSSGVKQKSYMVPHGLSVILTAPAVFRWTCKADPERHLRAAQLLGADTTNVRAEDAGLLLSDTITELLSHWRDFVPDGLGVDGGIGYRSDQLDTLVKGTLPQRKVIDVSPRQPTPDDFQLLLSDSMKLF